ncbi:MAG TPA: NAD(P)H-binding protein [Steroidobacteraceae bacterium]|nr:NAD(P)H-binding protein [Steroidobacteraceae bacterium]HRX88021.1 NAD(P)H-binding protein [Steroidobacteraceae bacterium]
MLALLVATLQAPVVRADGVLVFGGTGRLGSEIVGALLVADERVTVFVRPESDRRRLQGKDVRYVVGDLLDAASVTAAFRAVRPRVAIDASALYDRKHEPAIRNIVAGALANGSAQVIHHGSVGAGDNMKLFPAIDFTELAAILHDKGRAEELLIGSGLNYTIIRNGMLENDDAKSTGQARLTEDLSALGRITRRDLAALTLQCVDSPRCRNRVLHALDDHLDSGKRDATRLR